MFCHKLGLYWRKSGIVSIVREKKMKQVVCFLPLLHFQFVRACIWVGESIQCMYVKEKRKKKQVPIWITISFSYSTQRVVGASVISVALFICPSLIVIKFLYIFLFSLKLLHWSYVLPMVYSALVGPHSAFRFICDKDLQANVAISEGKQCIRNKFEMLGTLKEERRLG